MSPVIVSLPQVRDREPVPGPGFGQPITGFAGQVEGMLGVLEGLLIVSLPGVH